jgi:histidine triad (HIT) family protein
VQRDPECLFCRLFETGDHVAKRENVVAIRDINPQAETHLLVIPRRHVPSFHEIGEYPADELREMLEFVAEVASAEGLADYRVVVNAGRGAGQTIFHLHWHILSGGLTGRMA